jgi:cobalt-zinc-cadmium resistance protein CzcA
MLAAIIRLSVKNKFIVLLFTLAIVAIGVYSLINIKLGAVPDITNNQVQIITTSQNLSTQDIEQYVTYPVELEMANLPGVKEIRSVSKFGLSVVTVVFEDDLGTYLPRQLIAEKIKSAREQIPDGFGTPEMGPITTGLGEIYQYTIEVEEEFKDRYSVMDLRTIQDWIVRRQLSGIEGVVEINTWGGYLKQYEVSINPARLNAMNITINQVYDALQKNNGVTGGAYIEKTNTTYFIRAEGKVNDLKDIENIVVLKREQTPVYIKDIAEVGYGHANRFGAITANGSGEKVMGQVMMLKGASSNDVIKRVKKRVAEVQKTLPKGVYINPFLERSELIGRTTSTIAENLTLGCLIVILVVVLLLGNLRSGLVVASVIPLSLLFALTMMYLFDVDANLMSLGAIDFGIIIDGAVIIVEFTAFQFNKVNRKFKELNPNEAQKLKDQTTVKSAGKMMNSAIFGQMIILLVFIPILSLQGVEGKMFKPMALTFSFALIGEMILCFTYVPVASSLWLKSKDDSKLNVSDRIINFLNRLYEPSIRWAVQSKRTVIAIALGLLVLAGVIFSQMGGEFVPTLDEGDFVVQPILKTGTSLSETIDMMTKLERAVVDNFPEVEQAVSRIGAAEVPTDPMSMEQTDLIITLKDKDEWVLAESKEELAALIKKELEPYGVGVEFTQPIEMRFNELITGVRSDIAIKVFGEDLQLLSQKANEIKSLVEGVDGAADVMVEKTEGLPQMLVNYKRDKIARYGLNISDVNDLISLAYAGKTAGVVFEGEKRFDLVVRLAEDQRKSIEGLQNLYFDLPEGGKVPLRELADVSYDKGAAMISRDNTRRRIVVRVNVRDRDLQSVVDDMRSIIDQKLDLPVGYSVTYGGQFENLSSAKERLFYAVPLALVLIFIMLYFAFGSVREALLIYSAIPLATVGGVFMLEARGLPFSISAGIGFIALFGIAVLNGIVLIDHFKELQKSTQMKIDNLVVQGGKDRMRAVLLTATSTAFGFLPMAFSTNAGAEVQRPLATVVIGGMISATLLTLIVLPVLYSIFVKRKMRKNEI